MKQTISIIQAKQCQAQLNLVRKKLAEVAESLAEARAQGDLSENADFDAAKSDYSQLKLEESHLTEQLKADIAPYDHGATISVGSIVDVTCPELCGGATQSYLLANEGTIMFSRILSTSSALGKVIVGNASGTYTVNGHVFNVSKQTDPDLDAFFEGISEPCILPSKEGI